MKPISFRPNDEMIRAILDGRKTVTRRAVKPQPRAIYYDGKVYDDDGLYIVAENQNGGVEQIVFPYRLSDILYVREMWKFMGSVSNVSRKADRYIYRATWSGNEQPLAWRSSIYMPKKAARIFLRVTDVKVERLQDIDDDKALKEGCGIWGGVDWAAFPEEDFKRIWGNTIKPADRALYGWDSNPWVWVIEFEQIEKSEVFKV